MMCDNSTGCEEADGDDHFATETDTMIDIVYEVHLCEI